MSSSSAGTAASPASSSSATNGVPRHTSVAMITANDDQRSPSQARSEKKDRSGVNAYRQAKAATTVMIPYGSSTAVCTVRRPTTERCRTTAIASPSSSSSATDTTVMTAVARTAAQKTGEDSAEP